MKTLLKAKNSHARAPGCRGHAGWAWLVAALSLGLMTACSKKEAAAPAVAAPTTVRAEKVVYSSQAIPVYATGVLSRRTEANLSFKVGGIVEEIAVRAGDAVKQGQILARLRLAEIDAHAAQARSLLEKAQRDLARVESLRADRVATLENLQDARTAVESAEAGVQIAAFNRLHAAIVAPSDGRILRRLAEPDEMVEAGHAVLIFASDGDGWIVRAGIAERDVARLHIGDRAQVNELTASPLPARVTQISEAAEPATRTTEVELLLEVPPTGGRSGYVVRTVITPQPVTERPVVAASALIEGTAGKAYLFFVEANSTKAKRIQVDVAGIDGDRVFLDTPLPRDASVVNSGAEYLQDGAAVNVAGN